MTDVQDQLLHTMLPVKHMVLTAQSLSPPPSFTPTPVIFPSEDISETYTHASYSNDSIPELVSNDQGNWMFSLNVPIPDEMVYPTLTSLEYTIKYGRANGQDTSMIQTSILLAKVSDSSSDVDTARVLDGITTDTPNISIYRTGVGFPPQVLNGVPTVCLLSVPAVKENCHTSQRNHYVDRQQFLPYVRIIEASRLYLQLHVTESPSPIMLRTLVAEVSATWVEDLQGRVLHDKIQAAQTRKAVAESKRAEDEQARLQAERNSAEAKLVRDKAEEEEKSAKKKSEYDQLAKKLADEQADRHRIAKEQADALAETHRVAKKAADAAAH
ncbi:hypothetical protein EV702DRAFT_1064195 [Suillus placidus]|uniref:Uncharacterized protein n=1 Tax=Suillus placidus TaxID=48579 RepID=A0A9P7D806_9AGAM|nr:hypothetical protein EV702DRAFT_1064195 [Suillus placidus]